MDCVVPSAIAMSPKPTSLAASTVTLEENDQRHNITDIEVCNYDCSHNSYYDGVDLHICCVLS